MTQNLTYLSENELNLYKEYLKQFTHPKKRKQEMIEIIKSGAKDGLIFEFGYPDVPTGYAVFSDLPKKYQRVISAFKVLAHEISDEETKYILDSSDFLFNQKNGSIRAPIKKINLAEKVEDYESDNSGNLDSSGNFGNPILPSYLEKLAFFRIKYLNSHKK